VQNRIFLVRLIDFEAGKGYHKNSNLPKFPELLEG